MKCSEIMYRLNLSYQKLVAELRQTWRFLSLGYHMVNFPDFFFADGNGSLGEPVVEDSLDDERQYLVRYVADSSAGSGTQAPGGGFIVILFLKLENIDF